MLISLIVYAHNAANKLNKCLESIASQDFDDYEVIIVDDGSTDGSGAICDEFAADHYEAKVIHATTAGRANARNCGIEAAKGDWLWFIDGGDYIADGALSAIKERMRYAEGELYVFQHMKADANRENPKRFLLRDNQERINIKNDGDLRWNYSDRIFTYRDGWEVSCRLFNRKIVTENGLRFKDSEEIYSDDLCFFADYMMYVSKATLLVNFLYVFGSEEEAGTCAQKDVIPRLLNLLEGLYDKAVKLGKNQVVKEFYMIVRGALGYQIQNRLGALSDDEICREISEAVKRPAVGKHVKKVKKELITAARADRVRN